VLDQASVKTLLESAESETKRWGGKEFSLTHVAYAASRKWDKEFTAVFGDKGGAAIVWLLQRHILLGKPADVQELLTEATTKTEFLKLLRDELAGDLLTAYAGQRKTKLGNAEAKDSEKTSDNTQIWVHRRTQSFVQEVIAREDVIGRDEVVDEIQAQLLRPTSVITALVGRKGSGRTAVLAALAQRFKSAATPRGVWRVSGDTDFSGSQMLGVVEDAPDGDVVVFDDFDSLTRIATNFPNLELLQVAAAFSGSRNTRVVLIMDERHLPKLGTIHAQLMESLVTVYLPELTQGQVKSVLETETKALASMVGVKPSEELIASALMPKGPQDIRVHPGLALWRLEPALTRAAVAGETIAQLHHLAADHPETSVASASANLAEALEARVKGQTKAIRKVSDRLSITRANLDLRPERPNGVFLFVGPTGVGKTELAKEIARHEYGGYENLIRLDMSEYSHAWGVSRIAGPMPGYLGSDEPSGWLTTKVAAKPKSVILLDEIEKAHPTVWNIFLQVFDAGRMTDSRGVTADFKDAIFILTSNLGVIESNSSSLGFGSSDEVALRRSDRILEVVKERMAPELINRMDELIVFDPLSMEAISAIAEAEMAQVLERLAEAGWSITIGDGVTEHLANTGYDPAYGARHLQRNIERIFLTLLANSPTRNLEVNIRDGELTATTR
jgi:ATP-dependent Clp protease ATP-binding subunit ClpA